MNANPPSFITWLWQGVFGGVAKTVLHIPRKKVEFEYGKPWPVAGPLLPTHPNKQR